MHTSTHQPPAAANASTSTPLNSAAAKAPTLAPLPAMTATEILAALICLAEKAESRAVVALLAPPPGSKPEHTFSDLRLDIAGDITETLDEIHPGLGLRLMRCMYPEVDFDQSDLEVPLPQLFDVLGDEVPS